MNSPFDDDGRIEPTMGLSRRRNPDAVLLDKKKLNLLDERKAEPAFPLYKTTHRIHVHVALFIGLDLPFKPNSNMTARCHAQPATVYAQFLRAAHVGVGLGVEPVASKR